MPDYSKSPTNLGYQIHEQLCGTPETVLPVIHRLVTQEGPDVIDYIGEQWGITGENFVPKALRNLAAVSPNSIPHLDNWKFLLRAVQCAALANRRLEARLEPLTAIGEDPHVIAVEMIHDLGQRAVSLLGEAMDTEFLANYSTFTRWNRSTRGKIEQLCIKPHIFAQVMSTFSSVSAPEQLPGILATGPEPSMLNLYRITTAAAAVGQQVHIEFIPSEQPS